MRILFLTGGGQHAHCYGTDALLRGFQHLHRHGDPWVVHALPFAPHRHIPLGELRDPCQIDSDGWAPAVPLQVEVESHDVLICTTTLLDGALAHAAPALARKARKVIGINYSDLAEDQRPAFETLLGRPVDAYCQREWPLPEGAYWLPLTVADDRVRLGPKPPTAHPRVFYRGTNHNWGLDSPRVAMMRSIEQHVPGNFRSIHLSHGQEGHVPPEVYREWLWWSEVSVVWNSWHARPGKPFAVWDSHRLWDSLALGCAVVAERPPHPLLGLPDNVVSWVDRPEDIGPEVSRLLRSPDALRARMKAGRSRFVQHHVASARARDVLATVGIRAGIDRPWP